MHNLMRKYKKHIMIITIALIIGPFVVWGGYRGSGHGGSGEEDATGPMAVAGGVPISAAEFRKAVDEEVKQRSRYNPNADFESLVRDGTAQKVFEDIVSARLLAVQAAGTGLEFDQNYLVEKLKEECKDDQGNFDAEKWNQWVEYTTNQSGQSWNDIYASLSDQLRRQLFVTRAVASGRVIESDLKKAFEDMYTKYHLMYAAVEPKIEPTEEQIKATYDENPSRYDIPEKLRAQFVAISLEADKPAVADEIVSKARAGEDFAELAKQYSEGDTKDRGGEMDWVTESPDMPDHLTGLFQMVVGDVSDAVKGAGGVYYIFKLEEERTSEVTAQRDVKARVIELRPQLTEEQIAEREAKAQALATKARETGDLAAAAAEAGLIVQTSGMFSQDSGVIENIPAQDAWKFRMPLTTLAEGEVSEVITGQANLYVAKIIETEPPVPQPFDAVRDRVLADTIEKTRRSPEYRQEARAKAEEIMGKVASLSQAEVDYPDLKLEVKEVTNFSQRDYDYMSGPPLDAREVAKLVVGKKAGDMVGPVQDFMGKIYLLQFVAKTPPGEDVWNEKWTEEEENFRRTASIIAQRKRMEDYMKHLFETQEWTPNAAVYQRELGLEQFEQKPEEDVEGGEEAAEETPGEAADETADSAAAESAETEPKAE